MPNSEWLGMSTDERITWHNKKLEIAEAQLHYHQEQLSKLLAFKANTNYGSQSQSY